MPFDAIAGATENSPGFVFPVTMNETACELSLVGPALIFVAHTGTDCAPASLIHRLIGALGEARRIVHRIDP